jgi:hypothetical protein
MSEIQNKSERSKHIIYIDIENTIIDEINNPIFMENNCIGIDKYIKSKNPKLVNLFTWGWKTSSEVDPNLVKKIFDVLQIPEDIRGLVYTKEDSVNEAISVGWLKDEDKERALHPGMMSEFGIGKINCFFPMVCNICIKDGITCTLIDDLVTAFEHVPYTRGGVILVNPMELYEWTI